MNSKTVVAVSLVPIIGLVAWLFLRPCEAQVHAGQQNQGWEYKVVAFVAENANSRNVDDHTTQINSLAAEGWEYVGLLCSGPNPHQTDPGYHVSSGGNVLFKRPKR
jgi:hypothetical protein